MATTFRIALVGSKGCGKSAFMRRHLTGEFFNESIPLTRCDVRFATNKGNYTIVFVEDEKNTDGMIYMMNLTKPQNEQKIRRHLEKYQGPKVLCGNKCDRKGSQTPMEFVRHLMITQFIKYFEISAKSNYNFEKPILTLLRELTNQSDLEFIAM